jgi:hypothetical protein
VLSPAVWDYFAVVGKEFPNQIFLPSTNYNINRYPPEYVSEVETQK